MLPRIQMEWPRFRKEHLEDIPQEYNWGTDWIDRLGKEEPERVALIHTDGNAVAAFTFREISELSSAFARYLQDRGMGRGDRVMIMLGNQPMLWVSFVGVIKAGGVCVPSATSLRPSDIDYRITKGNISGAIIEDSVQGALAGLRHKLRYVVSVPDDIDVDRLRKMPHSFTPVATRPSDVSLIYFTSGTTGHPKMVAHSQVSYALGHYSTAMWLGIGRGDVHWNISSPGWAKHAWSSIYAPWNVAATTVSFSYTGRFRAADHLGVIEKLRVTSVCASPTVWRMFILEDLSRYDLSSLRSAASAGEPLNPEVIERFRNATGITIRDGYGQTETTLQIGNFPGMQVKDGSMGVASPFYRIAVVDDSGRELPPMTEGNIAIRVAEGRPLPLMLGYMEEENNRQAFHDGWYFTGDRAYVDADGYFWYVGRSDDVIKSSGYRIGPFEVESALLRHPSVAESAAVASPDQIRGAIVKCFVVLKPGYEPSYELARELAEFVAQETAPYKHPRKIEFVSSLDPVKTISGKIRRKALREMEYGGPRVVQGSEFEIPPLR